MNNFTLVEIFTTCQYGCDNCVRVVHLLLHASLLRGLRLLCPFFFLLCSWTPFAFLAILCNNCVIKRQWRIVSLAAILGTIVSILILFRRNAIRTTDILSKQENTSMRLYLSRVKGLVQEPKNRIKAWGGWQNIYTNTYAQNKRNFSLCIIENEADDI
jgi:hypothetical protein